MRTGLVVLQALTFIGLACVLVHEGELRLAGAQTLLGFVTWLIYF